jgi:hypothetical protein
MRTLIRALCLFVTMLLLTVQADAAPQQMVFFKQRIRVGAAGGKIAVACANVKLPAPGPKDRYTHFSGNMRVTRYENGKKTAEASLQDAVSKHGWFEITGERDPNMSTSSLSVRPKVNEKNVVYEVEILNPGLGATDTQTLNSVVKGFDGKTKVLGAVQSAREAAAKISSPELKRVAERRVQNILWEYDGGRGRNQKATEETLARLPDEFSRLEKDKNVKEYLAMIEKARKLAADLPVPELARSADLWLDELSDLYAWGQDRERSTATISLKRFLTNITDLKDAKSVREFFQRVETTEALAKNMPFRVLSLQSENRLRDIREGYIVSCFEGRADALKSIPSYAVP